MIERSQCAATLAAASMFAGRIVRPAVVVVDGEKIAAHAHGNEGIIAAKQACLGPLADMKLPEDVRFVMKGRVVCRKL